MSTDLLEALNVVLDAHWDPNQVPGLAVGMSIQGEHVFLSRGVTSVEAPRPVTAETLFQIGSISKTYTCLALLTFIEAGHFELEKPIRSYLPHFRVADEQTSKQVTIRHLLTHLAGWQGDFFINTGRGDDALARYVARMAELPQIAPVGRFLSYNNAGFYVAGHLIELASGKPYEAALKAAVLDPLGLADTFFHAEDVISRHFSVGHHPKNGAAHVARPWALARCGNAVGGIVTSIRDLMRYSDYYLTQGGSAQHLLSPETFKTMLTPQHWIWTNKEAVGLSWFIEDAHGERLISHGGATNGQVSGLFLVPSKRAAVGVVTNSSGGGELIRKVSRWALETAADLRWDDDIRPAHTPDLSQVVGRYTRPFAEVELKEEDGRLIAKMRYLGGFPTEDDPTPPDPPLMRLAATEPERFLVQDGPAKSAPVDIIRDSDGKIGWVRLQRRLFKKAL